MTRGRRTAAALFGIALAFVCLELVLQMMAYAAWRRGAFADEDGASAEILCIGDSFTAGLGAALPERDAYPVLLGTLLDPPAEVARVARPGRDSRDVLEQLPDALERFGPRRVLILVGWNDVWTRPERLEVPPEPSGSVDPFPWRWRTARLFEWLARGRGPSPAADGSRGAPPRGVWHAGTLRLKFLDEGGVAASVPSIHLDEQGRLIADGPPRVVYAMRREGEALILEEVGGSQRIEFAPGEPPAAEAALAAAERTLAERGDPAAARTLLVAAQAELDAPRMLAACEVLLAADPVDAMALEALRRLAGAGGEARGPALDLLESTWRALPVSDARRFGLWRVDARLRKPDVPDDRLARVFAAWRGDGDEGETLRLLTLLPDLADPERVARVLEASDADTATKEAFRAVVARSRRPLDEVEATLAHHLQWMVQLCRDRGVEPILLSYPEPVAVADAARARVAAAAGVRTIELHDAFAQFLTHHPRGELFIPDGHCTTLGYRRMAEVVATALD